MIDVRSRLGINDIHEMGYSGENIGVAILDTGIYTHNDFIKPVSRIVAFRDFINNKRTPYDDNGHGTHVAGICASNGYASNGLYKGVAPNCNIIAIKVLDSYGMGSIDSVTKALLWVLQNKDKYNIKIVNLSIGTYGKDKVDSKYLIEVVEKVWDAGIVVLTAAGNKGPKPRTITIPGTSKKIITVGTYEEDINYIYNGKKIVHFSGCGPTKDCIVKPEVVAPGCNIISCSNMSNSYIGKSGTSMATPIVSGVIALTLEEMLKNRGNYGNYKEEVYINKLIKIGIYKTSIDIGRNKNNQGWGLINPLGLLKYVSNLY